MFENLAQNLFWKNHFREKMGFISNFRMTYPSFNWVGLESSRRFDEISAYWLNNGQRLKKSPDEAILSAFQDFSKWYLERHAGKRRSYETFEEEIIPKIEADYVHLRKVMLDLIVNVSPILSFAEREAQLPRFITSEQIEW